VISDRFLTPGILNMKTRKYFRCFILHLAGIVFLLLCSCARNKTISKLLIKVSDGIYVYQSPACNVGVIIGKEGILIVDTGHEWNVPLMDSIIKTASDLPFKYVLNTHFHNDHCGGNKILASQGAEIIAQENSKKHMLSEYNVPEMVGIKLPIIPPYSKEYLPAVCFQDSFKLYFKNDTILGIHVQNGHSDGDAIYYFHEANVVFTGDIFFSNGLPFIDIFYGGSTDGYIEAVDDLIQVCNEGTIVIPGHGAISNRQGLQEYRSMLAESRNRIDSLIKTGMTLEQLIKADPTKDLLKGGESLVPSSLFLAIIYKDFKKN
jgi:cyclase